MFLTLVEVLLIFLLLVMTISVVIGVPFVPVHRRQAKLMMDLAGVKPGQKVVDLGSGAGRLLFLAAARGAIATGYELNPFLYWWTKMMIWLKGLNGRVFVRRESIYKADLSGVDIAFTFLLRKQMNKLSDKLFSELKSGSRVASYAFSIPGKTPIAREQAIYVYRV